MSKYAEIDLGIFKMRAVKCRAPRLIFIVVVEKKRWPDVATSCYKVDENILELECGPMPNVMGALPNIGGAFCSTPQSLADDHY